MSIKKSLIIGMGIGELYKSVLKELNHIVYTVDTNPDKKADFQSVSHALDSLHEHGSDIKRLDTVHICTPNWTHETIAYQVAPYTKIVFIEKPGLKDESRLDRLHKFYPSTRFMMVKNNMWRDEIDELRHLGISSDSIHLNWINNDRVPNPGTWFTDKELSFGGVSRDLIPHLLSFVAAIFPPHYKNFDLISNYKDRAWHLSDLTNTEYGVINPAGKYNVDDLAGMSFYMRDSNSLPLKLIMIEADWRTLEGDDRSIVFNIGGIEQKYEFGLCPEYAYKKMINDCIDNVKNQEFWTEQYDIDLWIHKMVNEL